MDIFNIIGYIFGYLLWAAFYLVKNFGIAIILFTILIKALLFPFSIKQQKSMAAQSRLQQRQREISEKYKNDKVKANEEMQKIMQQENANPLSGCLPMAAPMLVMLGVYYSVINPLTNTLHIDSTKVQTTLNSLSTLPGIGTSINSQYGQISIVKYFDHFQKFLTNTDGSQLFNSNEISKIHNFGTGFNFCGLDLLATPSASTFASMMWLIPVLCFVTSVASMFIMQKMNGTQMKGCMSVVMFIFPLFSAWIAYTVPAAVGFYWIASTVLGFIQSMAMLKFYNASIIEAQEEAQRVVLRHNQEAEVAFIDAVDYEDTSTDNNNFTSSSKSAKSSQKSKSKKSGGNSASNYKGKKK